MKFVCDRCQTKYSIADERVRGKILKVKCKSCANVITVREERRPSAAGISTISATGHDSERTVLAPNPGLLPEPLPRQPSGPLPTTGAPDDGLAWYMALSGERSGPFSRKQLVDKVIALPKNADLHIWNEQLGSWKPPADVPAVARDLAARRKSPPALPPGAPRRGTPAPPPPLAALGDKAMRRPTGSGLPTVGPPLGSSLGLKLPPPSGGAQPRPSASASASALSGAGRATATARAPDSGIDIDPATMLETPAPQLHMLHGHAGTHGANGTNGVGQSASAHPPARATRSSSDVLNLLNLPGAPPNQAGSAPRLMSSAAAVGWSPSVEAPAARARKAKLIFAFLGVIAVICIVFVLNAMKKHELPPIPAPKAAVTDPLAGVVEKMAAPQPLPPPTVAPIPEPPPPPPPTGHGKGAAKGRGTKGGRTVAAPVTVASVAPVVDNTVAARYRDTTPGVKVNPTAAAPNRPPPSQAQISSVINNNRGGIKNCYQRALLRDSSLTHGKITVKLTLGISGRVKQVAIDGPQQFKTLDPCIKELVSRWVFPQASEEYGTEFVYVFQGNE